MGSAYRLHRRTCYTKKEPSRRISEVLKVAATYSPTTQCSTIGDAVSLPSALRAEESGEAAEFNCMYASLTIQLAYILIHNTQGR